MTPSPGHFTMTTNDGDEHYFSKPEITPDQKTLFGVTGTLASGIRFEHVIIEWNNVRLHAALVMVHKWLGSENKAEFRLGSMASRSPE